MRVVVLLALLVAVATVGIIGPATAQILPSSTTTSTIEPAITTTSTTEPASTTSAPATTVTPSSTPASTVPRSTTTSARATTSTAPRFVPPAGQPPAPPPAPSSPVTIGGTGGLPIFIALSLFGFATALIIMGAQWVHTRPRR